MTTTTSNEFRAARWRLVGGTWLTVGALVLLSSAVGCGEEFSSCSETRSCFEDGGTAGAGGSVMSGSGGTTQGDAEAELGWLRERSCPEGAKKGDLL